jgi:hypothetical protein
MNKSIVPSRRFLLAAAGFALRGWNLAPQLIPVIAHK